MNYFPSSADGILGIQGLTSKPENIFCLVADANGKFLSRGIVNGTLVYVDSDSAFAADNLNAYFDVDKGYFLSSSEDKDALYAGKVIMTVNLQ